MRLPDFLIGGAPRSGTTWLYHLLARHPRVYMARPVQPEPKFFLVDELYACGLEWYSQTWFKDVPDGMICGEKSTNYLESERAARLIAADLPGVRVVFILRDPVERAWSNYLWSRMNGLEDESFERALELEERRESGLRSDQRYSRPHAYLSRGLYARMLEPWFAMLPRASILCLRFEDIASRPADIAERLHRFLGLPPRGADVVGLGVINPSARGQSELAPQTRRRLQSYYAQPNSRLAQVLGSAFEVWS